MRFVSIACLLLLAAATAFAIEEDWSWGIEGKEPSGSLSEPVLVEFAATEARSEGHPLASEGAFVDIAALPLAEESDSFVYESLPPEIVSGGKTFQSLPLQGEPYEGLSFSVAGEGEVVDGLVVAQEGDREGRFLGLGEKLCSYGIGINCDKKQSDPVKSHYAPPRVGQYGPPKPIGPKGTYAAAAPYPPPPPRYPNRNYQVGPPTKAPSSALDGLFSVLKPFMPDSKPKAPPKISKGDVLSPSYIAPNPNYAPLLPSYTPPIKPGYTAPAPSYISPPSVYSPPKPAYVPPKPSYHAPEPNYDVKPSYSSPKVSYVEPKPVYVEQVKTVTVHAQPTVVEQHHHTHTHVYNDKTVPANVYKSDPNGLLQSVHDSINQFDEYSVQRQDISDSFSLGESQNVLHVAQPSVNQVAVKQQVPSVNQVVVKQQIPTSFPSISPAVPTVIPATLVGGTNFQPGKIETGGFRPMPQELQTLFRQQLPAYREDCQCVPVNFCSAQDVVPRNAPGDIRNMIDARTRGTNILSNATDIENDGAVNVTGSLGFNEIKPQSSVRRGKALSGFDKTHQKLKMKLKSLLKKQQQMQLKTTEYLYDYEEDVTEAVTEAATEVPEILDEKSRSRRDVNATALDEEEQQEDEEEDSPAIYSDRQGRQLHGFTPNGAGCGANHVCCRRPVYRARQVPQYTCGQRSASGLLGRVKTAHFVQGDTEFGEYPWQGAVLKRENADNLYVCGATLIDDRHVLTAAHCVDGLHPSILNIRLGEWDVSGQTEFYKHVEMRASGVYIHPDFYAGNLNNDIAVIRMEHPVDFSTNPHITPVCLPEKFAEFTYQRCHATGWGKDAFGSDGKFSQVLKEIEVPIIDDQQCQQMLRNTRLGAAFTLHEGNFCAGGENGKDTCKGDGGGPLVCSTTGGMQLAGLVSWGIGCGSPGVPGVYVKVSNYVDWIKSITKF
ncbi:LOW QUALITY PROTEIN: serine protease filzig-like [Macrobrachium rosenbergii]|uniref:LOW QUALITY PROTEIN: serine protease filzig-like n=1 Tax=Macrobrachium rosenbergii TaxID=79674 RepID=UPI0034D79299